MGNRESGMRLGTSGSVGPSSEPLSLQKGYNKLPQPGSRKNRGGQIDQVTQINRLRIGCWGSGIVFLWAILAYFMREVVTSPSSSNVRNVGELATLLFGASSLGLIIFSVLLGISAFIGWQSLKTDVQNEVEASQKAQNRVEFLAQEAQRRTKELEEKIDKRGEELRGRAYTIMGLMVATVHSNPTTEQQKLEDKEYLAEAIHFFQTGYDVLKELEGNGKYMALNNIVYFSCLLRLDAKRHFLLEQGRVIKEVGRKYEDRPNAAPYLLTFCRVVSTYGTEREEIREALSILEALSERKELTALQTKEATYLVARLNRKLRDSRPPN